MKSNKVMAMPKACFFAVVAICVMGIIIGSFCDYSINVALANKTDIGAFFATYGSYFSYCLYPAAGMCIFKGLTKKGSNFKMLAWIILIIAFFLAVYYSNSYNGSKVRELFGYKAGESCAAMSILSWGFWVVLYAWVPIVCYFIFDDTDADKLIFTGAAILVAGIVADNVNLWLKQVSSRPRYKYLITLDDPEASYRNWWEMIPNLAGSNDNFKSWPSGNMTIASMMFSLPMLSDVLKKRSNVKNAVCFAFAVVFVVIYGYNRIHMTNHFLSDVCFGTLITYLIFSTVSTAFLRPRDGVTVSFLTNKTTNTEAK
ncbi:MAG: phosphatase PAP2 family protein [Lachnospiraceae bacterium]|nr:phosphatase PAP2 family protein [Lachnospiraceae bacterium]